MSSFPTLPVPSNPPATAASQQSRVPRSSLRCAFARRRPWSELVDTTAFSRPDTLSAAASRVRKNFSYFRVNYLPLLAAVLAFSFVSHPFTLITLLAAWLFLYLFRPSDQPVVVLGRTFSDGDTLGILILLTVVVIFLTSVGSIPTSVTLIGAAIVCVHGAFWVGTSFLMIKNLSDQD